MLHEHQALLNETLRQYIIVVLGYEDHKLSACRQFESLQGMGVNLPLGHAGSHMDYKQSLTIPLGPDEPGTWWFATARRSVIAVGAHILRHAPT